MRFVLVTLCAAVAALSLSASALADPPTLLTLGSDGLHPTATFSIQRAVYATISISQSPDRAADGGFVAPLAQVDLTGDEIAGGSWRDPSPVAPGTYWVLLHATADFDSCWEIGFGWDPTCPDGWSTAPQQLAVREPTPRYGAAVTVLHGSQLAQLRLTATPLGVAQPYRVCFAVRATGNRCVDGTLVGTSWETAATATLRVDLRGLAPVTRFSWYVGGARVASVSARVRTPARRAPVGRP